MGIVPFFSLQHRLGHFIRFHRFHKHAKHHPRPIGYVRIGVPQGKDGHPFDQPWHIAFAFGGFDKRHQCLDIACLGGFFCPLRACLLVAVLIKAVREAKHRVRPALFRRAAVEAGRFLSGTVVLDKLPGKVDAGFRVALFCSAANKFERFAFFLFCPEFD